VRRAPGHALIARKVTGRAFDRQIGSTKRGDRDANGRIKTGFAFDRHICYGTGDRKWSSGESRFKRAFLINGEERLKEKAQTVASDAGLEDRAANCVELLAAAF
jgi:hypothetical protein